MCLVAEQAVQVLYSVTWISGSASQEAQAGLGSVSNGCRASSRRRARKKSGASCGRVLSNDGHALRMARQHQPCLVKTHVYTSQRREISVPLGGFL